MKNTFIPANQRHLAEMQGLKSYHIFSFANYFDPKNMQFGNMRVFNDDIFSAGIGFGMHPHDNMEIITVVLDGEISHEDNLGNSGVTTAGEIQTMTAGTGVLHSEKNTSGNPVHLYQIWFLPRERNLNPKYENHYIPLQDNNLCLLASGNPCDKVGYLHTDIKIYRGLFKGDKNFKYDISPGKGLFIYITTGALQVGDQIIEAGDQIRYTEVGLYSFTALEKSDFILIEVSL